jgi:hypothetical protein
MHFISTPLEVDLWYNSVPMTTQLAARLTIFSHSTLSSGTRFSTM